METISAFRFALYDAAYMTHMGRSGMSLLRSRIGANLFLLVALLSGLSCFSSEDRLIHPATGPDTTADLLADLDKATGVEDDGLRMSIQSMRREKDQLEIKY